MYFVEQSEQLDVKIKKANNWVAILQPAYPWQRLPHSDTSHSELSANIPLCVIDVLRPFWWTWKEITLKSKYLNRIKQYLYTLYYRFVITSPWNGITFHIEPLAIPIHPLDVEGLALVAALVFILHIKQMQQSSIHADLVVGWKISVQFPPADVWEWTKRSTLCL